MDLKLQGKKAIVTGGSHGMGKAIARQLALEGCDVAIGARTDRPLREAAEEITRETGRNIVPLVADTLNLESIKGFVRDAADALGGVHILANCAARVGGTIPDNMEVISDEQIVKDFEEKFLGYYRCAREVAPHMKRAGWGRIINLSGGAGRTPGTAISTPARNISCVALTKSLAKELAGQGDLTVNAISPAVIATPILEGIPQATIDYMVSRIPMGRTGKPEEVAALVHFLASAEASFTTGQCYDISGGRATY